MNSISTNTGDRILTAGNIAWAIAIASLSVFPACKDPSLPTSEPIEKVTNDKEPSVPILPVNCPTPEEIKTDISFGKYRALGCQGYIDKRKTFSSSSATLKDLLEPRFIRWLPEDTEVYRLVEMHAVTYPRVIRFQRVGNEITLIEKYIERIEPSFKERKLTVFIGKFDKNSWLEWKDKVNEAGIWKMEQDLPKYGADGWTWHLEIARRDRYHIVNRWAPEKGPFAELCNHLTRLAKQHRSQSDKVIVGPF